MTYSSLILALEAHGESVPVQQVVEGGSAGDITSVELQYRVSFCSIVLLDPNDMLYLIQHRSGEWTPPGGRIDRKFDNTSLAAAKREFQEETGTRFDNLVSRGWLKSMGVYAYFHPEASVQGQYTITLSYCFRLTKIVKADDLFNRQQVKTGETSACFVPLTHIKAMPVRACPLASLSAAFHEHFQPHEHLDIAATCTKWHKERNSVLIGNVREVALKRGRWVQ